MSAASISLGVTTGLCHQSRGAVDLAAQWLASMPEESRPHPLVPVLRAQFGLSALEAVQAIREANEWRRPA